MNEFLTFAADDEANVQPQANYDELGARETGFPAGLLPSAQLNKVLRQSAMVASAIAQLVADSTGEDVLDDGNRAALIAQISEMIGVISLEQSGAIVFKGTWNASANSPTLASGVGTAGWMYTVSVAGATNLDGITSWNVGDKAVFNGTAWEKIEGQASEVISVAGRVGAVVLTGTDVGVSGLDDWFSSDDVNGVLAEIGPRLEQVEDDVDNLGEVVYLNGAGPHAITNSHKGKTLYVTHTSTATVVLPQNTTLQLVMPFACSFVQGGAGKILFTVEGSDVLESSGGLVRTYGQYSGVEAIKRLDGAPNTYTLIGDLGAP